MGTPTHYPQRMAPASFTPTEQQKKLLAAVKRAKAKIAVAEAEYKRLLAECTAADIPVAALAAAIGTQRKSIYRSLGKPMK